MRELLETAWYIARSERKPTTAQAVYSLARLATSVQAWRQNLFLANRALHVAERCLHVCLSLFVETRWWSPSETARLPSSPGSSSSASLDSWRTKCTWRWIRWRSKVRFVGSGCIFRQRQPCCLASTQLKVVVHIDCNGQRLNADKPLLFEMCRGQ